MDSRKVILSSFTDITSLKNYILQKLNLVDHKRDSVAEFDERLQRYLDRNKTLEIVFQLDREKLERALKLSISLAKRGNQPFPDNFEMGNPHNRWFVDPIIKTERELEEERIESEKILHEKLLMLDGFLSRLKQLGNGRISIRQ